MPFLTIHPRQLTPQYGPTGEVSRPSCAVVPGGIVVLCSPAVNLAHACFAVMAGAAPEGGGAKVLSVPLMVSVAVTAIAWMASTRLRVMEMAITPAARTASPSAPVVTEGPGGTMFPFLVLISFPGFGCRAGASLAMLDGLW